MRKIRKISSILKKCIKRCINNTNSSFRKVCKRENNFTLTKIHGILKLTLNPRRNKISKNVHIKKIWMIVFLTIHRHRSKYRVRNWMSSYKWSRFNKNYQRPRTITNCIKSNWLRSYNKKIAIIQKFRRKLDLIQWWKSKNISNNFMEKMSISSVQDKKSRI